MKKQTLTLILLILGAFLLFYPQSSKAAKIFCKCTLSIGTGSTDYGCQYSQNETFHYSTTQACEKFKGAFINDRGEWYDAGVLGDGTHNLVPYSTNLTCEAFADNQCIAPVVEETKPTSIDNLYNDLSARKPVLEIKIPGLNFSNIGSTTDENGATYFYIAWLPELISALYKFLLAIVSIVAVVVIIIQGLRVVASGGGEGKTAAYKKIFQAIVGLFIAWGSYAILFTINPALVQFNALKVKVIEEQELPTYENAQDDYPEQTASKCTDPGIKITDPTKFDRDLNKTAYAAIKKLLTKTHPQMIPVYKQAEANTGIPWEMLAAIHYGEGGMRPNASIFNGGKLCNTTNDKDLLSLCPMCDTDKPSIQDDITCGGLLLQQKIKGRGKLNPNNPDIELIKLAMCGWNGCGGGKSACPEATPYVAIRFDQAHMKSGKKTAHDAVYWNCSPNNGCVRDGTIGEKNSCCKIRYYKGGQYSLNNGNPACCANDPTNSKINICTYTPTQYNKKTNPCGTWVDKSKSADRPGALVDYGIIKVLEANNELGL